MYCHIHHCHYHHCHCVPKDSKEKGGALTQEELLALTEEMKEELKDYTVDLKDQIFSYIDIGVNPVEIANTFASLQEQDTYILRTLTNKIDELNNTTNLSMFNLRTRVTDLEGQSATLINDLADLEGRRLTNTLDLIDRTERIEELETNTQVVESVADLSTIQNPTDGLRVYVKSYHAGLNKGGGYFDYDESRADENDGGSIINGWVSLSSPSYASFGAKLDGVTNDTEAFIAYHKLYGHAHLGRNSMLLDSIDLDVFKRGQVVGISITGDSVNSSKLLFNGGIGFHCSSNKFFREFSLTRVAIINTLNNKKGIGFHIVGGAEQVNLDSVLYSGWEFGRATHTWNSSMRTEAFRNCVVPFAQYGTSTDISNPYALRCDGAYMIGYAVSKDGEVSVSPYPYSYSSLRGFAADDCGSTGAIYKFGHCAGITMTSVSCERVKGEYIFDFTDLRRYANALVNVDGFTTYITVADNPNLVGVIRKPNAPDANVVFTNLSMQIDKELHIVNGDGSGVSLIDPKVNSRSWSQFTQDRASGIKVNNKSIGADSPLRYDMGFRLGAGSVQYSRVKRVEGTVLMQPSESVLSFYGGILSNGLPQGLMMVVEASIMPLNKGGGVTNEVGGIVQASLAMDYNTSYMDGHLKVFTSPSLGSEVSVERNTSEAGVLRLDLTIPQADSQSVFLVDLKLIYNGIENPDGISWKLNPI